jgi:hypothetical protein
MTKPARRDCAIVLTHTWSPALARHVDKLKREASAVLDVFVVFQGDTASVPDGMSPDLALSMDDAAAHFPRRAANLRQRAAKTIFGYVDIVWLTAFLNPRFAAYDRLWLIEYDVDFTGNWGEFFAEAVGYEGDLLLTRVRRLSADPGWFHAPKLALPAAAKDPLIGLFCLSRLSRPLIEGYREAVEAAAWDGHFEALIPTFAELAGYTVAEIGGEGPFTPPERINRHYTGGFAARASIRTTWAYKPALAYHYFVDRPSRFIPRNRLCHPIKTHLSPDQRRYFAWLRLRYNFRALLGR